MIRELLKCRFLHTDSQRLDRVTENHQFSTSTPWIPFSSSLKLAADPFEGSLGLYTTLSFTVQLLPDDSVHR